MLNSKEIERIRTYSEENKELAGLFGRMNEEHQAALSMVSHEVRNPVTLINSYLQMIADAHPEVQDYKYWDEVMDNMEFLQALLEDLSAYNNARRLQKEAIDLGSFLESILFPLRPMLSYLDITIALEKYAEFPNFMLDLVKFKQAIANLVRNAWESMEDGGHILVRLSRSGTDAQITVTDNGPGIPSEYIDTLFMPFVSHKKEGTGLGLAITKHVIEAHDGTILVSSREGEGTTFTLVLPTQPKASFSYKEV